MIFKDYYKILDLEDNKASVQQIKNAFREQAKKYHPDINKMNPGAEERFKDINEAYKVLSEEKTRKKYDRAWKSKIGKRKKVAQSGEKKPNGTAMNELFTVFFGNANEDKRENVSVTKPNIGIKGEDIDTEIEVSLEEAYYGLDKKISIRNVDGKITTFSIKIPKGIKDGAKIRLAGQGKVSSSGGANGDLYIQIKISKNDKFWLEGNDIITNLYITPWEAALGKSVNINSMEENITIDVPAGSQSGERIRVENKGYNDGVGGRGNLIAEIKTVVPRQLTDEEQNLFKKLEEVSTFNPRTDIFRIK